MLTLHETDIVGVIQGLNRAKGHLERLRADPTFQAWRHDEECGVLLSTVLNARHRIEDLRFVAEPDRSQRFAANHRGVADGAHSTTLMTAGARPQVWDRFNPKTSPKEAKAAGRFGSDQGWILSCPWTRRSDMERG